MLQSRQSRHCASCEQAKREEEPPAPQENVSTTHAQLDADVEQVLNDVDKGLEENIVSDFIRQSIELRAAS